MQPRSLWFGGYRLFESVACCVCGRTPLHAPVELGYNGTSFWEQPTSFFVVIETFWVLLPLHNTWLPCVVLLVTCAITFRATSGVAVQLAGVKW